MPDSENVVPTHDVDPSVAAAIAAVIAPPTPVAGNGVTPAADNSSGEDSNQTAPNQSAVAQPATASPQPANPSAPKRYTARRSSMIIQAGDRADTADAVETAIDRSKKDEKLTWAELVSNKQLHRNDQPTRPSTNGPESPKTRKK